MNNLATLYENGQGVKRSQGEALRLYRQAGEAGNVVALANAARMLEYGNGVPKNEAEAVALYRRAADGGDVPSISKLVPHYATGAHGFPRDLRQGFDLFRKAAEKGDPVAMATMATLIDNGFARYFPGSAPPTWCCGRSSAANSAAAVSRVRPRTSGAEAEARDDPHRAARDQAGRLLSRRARRTLQPGLRARSRSVRQGERDGMKHRLAASLAAILAAALPARADPGTDALAPFLDAVASCAGRSDLSLAVIGPEPGQTAWSREQAEEVRLAVESRLQGPAGSASRRPPTWCGSRPCARGRPACPARRPRRNPCRLRGRGQRVPGRAAPRRRDRGVPAPGDHPQRLLQGDERAPDGADPRRRRRRRRRCRDGAGGAGLRAGGAERRRGRGLPVRGRGRPLVLRRRAHRPPAHRPRRRGALGQPHLKGARLEVRRRPPGTACAGPVTARGRFLTDRERRSWMELEFQRDGAVLAPTGGGASPSMAWAATRPRPPAPLPRPPRGDGAHRWRPARGRRDRHPVRARPAARAAHRRTGAPEPVLLGGGPRRRPPSWRCRCGATPPR